MYSSVVLLNIWPQQILAAAYHTLRSAQMQSQSEFAFQTDTFPHAVQSFHTFSIVRFKGIYTVKSRHNEYHRITEIHSLF